MEFWDVGGSDRFADSRGVFYSNIQGNQKQFVTMCYTLGLTRKSNRVDSCA